CPLWLKPISCFFRRDRDLDQVVIRIAHIHRTNREMCAGSQHRPLFDRNVVLFEPRDHVLERTVGEKTQIKRTRRRMARFDAGFIPGRMYVEFLLAEFERDASLAKAFEPHAERLRVKRNASVKIARREHDVVKAFYHAAASCLRSTVTSRVLREGLTPRYTFTTFPCGSSRKVLRLANFTTPRLSSEP